MLCVVGMQLLATLATAAAAGAGSNGSKSPHLVFVMADDLGWSNVGYHNSHAMTLTPRIDRLVGEGIELDRHYVYYYCAPTRASFLTGRCVTLAVKLRLPFVVDMWAVLKLCRHQSEKTKQKTYESPALSADDRTPFLPRSLYY